MTDTTWLQLEGKTVAVTGAAGGIGEGICSAFAAAGANVALLDLNADGTQQAAERIVAAGGTATGFGCDISDKASIQQAAKDVEAKFGAVNVLVNNAAILRPGSLDQLSTEDWELMLRINLTGALLCSQIFGSPMLDLGDGTIVHVASISGHNPQPNSGAYSAGKAGLLMVSRQLAYEWGPRGVRSNTVSPGMIRTPLSEKFYEDESTRTRREAVIPSRRIGRPSDIADAVLFLSSPRASYINGQDILVDGGYSQALMGLVPRPGYED